MARSGAETLIELRWSDLKRMRNKREQNELTEPVVLKRKA